MIYADTYTVKQHALERRTLARLRATRDETEVCVPTTDAEWDQLWDNVGRAIEEGRR